jgi:hypothetical protein
VEDDIVSRRGWRVKEVIRGTGCVLQRIEACDLGNYAAQEPCSSDHGYRGRQERVIYVASVSI